MELLCPNCQKKLTVPEQYAGQIMRCPLCQGTFNVPSIPSTVAAESAGPVGFYTPPPKAETAAVAPDVASADAPGLPPISAETPSAASAAAPSGPSAGYSRVCAMKFNPQVVQWLPLGLVAVFLLMFFPWVSLSLGPLFEKLLDTAGVKASRNAWSLGFGEGGSALFIFYDLLTVLAMLLAVASLLFTLKVIPDVPALRPILPFRSLIVGAVAGLALLLISLDCLIGLLRGGVVPFNFWGIVAWWIHLVAVMGSFIEFWLEKRGPGKPAPRMSMEW